MALTTLTPAATFDAVRAPNNGTKLIAASMTDPPPSDEGPIRPALQALTNRDEFVKAEVLAVEAGTRSLAAVKIDGTGGATIVPTAGSLYVSGASTLIGNTEVGGTLIVAGASASARKLLVTVDSGGLAVAEGTLTKDLVPFAVAFVWSDGTIMRHTNLVAHPSSPKPATGRYRFITQTCPASCTGLSDGSVAPIVLQCMINDPWETSRGDNYLYRANAWAKKGTIAGSPVCVIDVAITSQDVTAGPSLTKTLTDQPFSLSIWA